MSAFSGPGAGMRFKNGRDQLRRMSSGDNKHTSAAPRAGLQWLSLCNMRSCQMATRTASVKKRISANGHALHRAMMRRMTTGASDSTPSDAETALIEERRQLKEERTKRKEEALQPRP